MMKSLDTERTRSRAAGDRDSDTIIDLRTALEIEREFRSSLTGNFVWFEKSAIEILTILPILCLIFEPTNRFHI